ncbi:MAG: 3-deoxy-D-manno-octulosonic acid transferase [Alphaproteobacteria bacterium]|nr:3-deoxy-D-manno-octulosonic acid transferase [Alphaproteobacteria bacterium]
MLTLYRSLLGRSDRVLLHLLKRRVKQGKEDKTRIGERMGRPSAPRPEGPLVWIHAASVGESQSALILVDALLRKCRTLRILVTTGTVTSAKLMADRLPPQAFHQFYPLDHPTWVHDFVSYWHPDVAFWMESELWPNMLAELRRRDIPSVLVNGRLSKRSYRRWRRFRSSIREMLSGFSLLLLQTAEDEYRFRKLGAGNTVVTDNLKYSAMPLPADETSLARLRRHVAGRPVWLYASTHEGEEAMACRIHNRLAEEIPGLLTILVPRHPHRGKAVLDTCLDAILNARRRSEEHSLPLPDDDVYIADTLGELGLFYRLCPMACIGRSFSKDGGGGHNPIEAAQLGCAVLHGPNVQNLADIYAEMDNANACIPVSDERHLESELRRLLGEPAYLAEMQKKGEAFARAKAAIIDRVMDASNQLLAERLGVSGDNP